MIQRLMKRWGVSPEETLFVGDMAYEYVGEVFCSVTCCRKSRNWATQVPVLVRPNPTETMK